MTNEELIKFLQDRIEHLDKMLVQSMEMNRKLMEKLGDRPVTSLPYPAPQPVTVPFPYDPSTPYGPIAKNCAKCGLKMEGVMGYVCTQPQCPTGLGGAWCGTQT